MPVHILDRPILHTLHSSRSAFGWLGNTSNDRRRGVGLFASRTLSQVYQLTALNRTREGVYIAHLSSVLAACVNVNSHSMCWIEMGVNALGVPNEFMDISLLTSGSRRTCDGRIMPTIQRQGDGDRWWRDYLPRNSLA